MKLVFVNRYFHPDQSATSRLLSDLARHLASRGWRVEIVCGRRLYDAPGSPLPARETVDGITVHRIWTSGFGRSNLVGRACDYLTFYPNAFLRLLRVVSRGDRLVAMTDPPLISVVAMWVARLKGAWLVNWIQDLFPEVAEALDVRPVRPVAPLLRWLRDRSLEKARCNVVIGDGMADHLIHRLSIQAPVETISNWSLFAAVERVERSRGSREIRRAWGLDETFVVAYSGNMGRVHEFGTLLAAMEALRHDRGIVFLFIGGGARRRWLEDEIRRRGLTNGRFLPYQPPERLMDSLGAADLHLVSLLPAMEGLVVPSKFHGIAAVGRPIVFVGAADGELARILGRCRNGVCVPPGDVSGLVRAIHHYRDDGEAWSRAGAASLRLARSQGRQDALRRWRTLLRGECPPPTHE